jgi:hypothetical protein
MSYAIEGAGNDEIPPRCPYCGALVRRRRRARWCRESHRVLAWRRKARQKRDVAPEPRNTPVPGDKGRGDAVYSPRAS